jgi:hypothetical protein
MLSMVDVLVPNTHEQVGSQLAFGMYDKRDRLTKLAAGNKFEAMIALLK